jgi:hypothetical protein
MSRDFSLRQANPGLEVSVKHRMAQYVRFGRMPATAGEAIHELGALLKGAA